MILRWFLSRTVRDAVALTSHVRKLYRHQRDLLTSQACDGLKAALDEMRAALRTPKAAAALRSDMDRLEKAANKWLKPYPHPGWRENVEMLLVALAVAMAIRTFWLQPFKIPTGSMQPTLFGVVSSNLLEQPELQIPTGLRRVADWFAGISYVRLKAKTDGTLDGASQPLRFLIFNIKQDFYIGRRRHTLWFPPDSGSVHLAERAGLIDREGRPVRRQFRAGEEVIRLRIASGDHLFVDRMAYNFRPPDRGEIIVFETKGIRGLPQDQFYIKRLVALGGEQVQIGEDRHLVIDGKRLDAGTPRFEFVYGFDPGDGPADSRFSGHVKGPRLAPLFEAHPEGVTLPERQYMVMGDNTMNSLDSRTWGWFAADSVIGKACFVYWPINTWRFGWGFW